MVRIITLVLVFISSMLTISCSNDLPEDINWIVIVTSKTETDHENTFVYFANQREWEIGETSIIVNLQCPCYLGKYQDTEFDTIQSLPVAKILEAGKLQLDLPRTQYDVNLITVGDNAGTIGVTIK